MPVAGLTRGQPERDEHDSAQEHLHGGERQHVQRGVRIADVHGGRGPAEYRDQDEQLHPEMAGTQATLWPDQQQRARESDHQAEQRASIERVRAPPACRQQRDPQRGGSIENGSLVRRHGLHGPVGAAVGDEHVAQRDNEHVSPFGCVQARSIASSSDVRPSRIPAMAKRIPPNRKGGRACTPMLATR